MFRSSASLYKAERKCFCLLQICKTSGARVSAFFKSAKGRAGMFEHFADLHNVKTNMFQCVAGLQYLKINVLGLFLGKNTPKHTLFTPREY